MHFINTCTLQLKCILFILALICSSYVCANEVNDNLSIRSFYTLSASIANENIAIVSNSNSPRILNKEKISVKNSILGSQLNYKFSNDFSLVVQGQLNFNDDDSLDTELNWAYVNYDLGDDANIRLGRFKTPFLKGTELRSIGFSRLWLRPLIHDNGTSGFNEYDGVDYLKKITTDKGTWDIQLGAGKQKHGLSFIDSKNIAIVSATYQDFDYLLRASLIRSNYQFSTQDNQLLSDNALGFLASVESEFYLSNWQINIGGSTGDTDFTPNDSMYYLSIAYHLGDFIPYAYSNRRLQKFESFTTNQTNEIPPNTPRPDGPPPTSPPPRPENAEPEGTFSESEFSIGLRWNFSTNHTFKLQASKIDIDNRAGTRVLAGAESGRIFSMTIEGVF